jgi:hypothetical protein
LGVFDEHPSVPVNPAAFSPQPFLALKSPSLQAIAPNSPALDWGSQPAGHDGMKHAEVTN